MRNFFSVLATPLLGTCADPEHFVRGVPTQLSQLFFFFLINVFFFFFGGGGGGKGGWGVS